MKVLIINLTRLGDLIQSQAAINDLQKAGHEVGLVCLENFASIASLLNNLSFYCTLNGASLLALTAEKKIGPGKNNTCEPASWGQAVSKLFQWRKHIQENFPYDCICNLTAAPSARLLANFLAQGCPVRGFHLDAKGYMENTNPWASFLEGTSMSRNLSPFNIVDIFRGIATAEDDHSAQITRTSGDSLLKPLPKEKHELMGRLLACQSPKNCQGYIGLQLGASHEKRRWPVEHFVQVGQTIYDTLNLCPVLLGSADEENLALEYASLARHPHVSLCGKTNIEELGATLGHLRMLITNDTGTMHFAVGMDIPILGIFLMTAQPFDTGPYQLNSCSLEPDIACHPCPFGQACPHDFACHRKILPETVSSLALSYLQNKTWQASHTDGSRIWIAKQDSLKNLDLVPLNNIHSARSAWLQILRYGLWSFFAPEHNKQRSKRCPQRHQLPQEICGTIQQELHLIAQSLELFTRQGQMLATHPLPPIKEKFLKNWEHLHNRLQASSYLGILAPVWAARTQKQEQALPDVLKAAADFQQLLDYFAEAVRAQ